MKRSIRCQKLCKKPEAAGTFSFRMKTIFVFCCLFSASWAKGEKIIAEGFERGEVSFQSSHKYAETNNKYFCKDPCDKEDILATVRAGGSVSLGRISLVDFGNGIFSVTFSRLQVSDSGTYWCGVDRVGVDTFTEVHLTVKEAEVITTFVPTLSPTLSPTWTHQETSNSTEFTTETNLSTASNATLQSQGGELNTSRRSGTVLYACSGAAIMLVILLLVACFRKRASEKKNSKPQTAVCSSSSNPDGSDEREADCEYDDIGEELHSIKILSERFSCAHLYEQDLPTSASSATGCGVSHPIYENVCFPQNTEYPQYSTPNRRDRHDVSSGIYVTPLPL